MTPILSRFPKDGKGLYSKANLIAGYRHLVAEGDLEPDPLLEARITMKPMRAAADDKDVLVRTEITGRGDPIQLDYRLEKTPGEGAGWKIYNLNVLGVWLVETYRGQFASEINARGVDGLIQALVSRNKSNAAKG